jgi:hypothetical protein
VRALLSEGADVNLKSIDPGLAGGRTPLVAASRQGYYEGGLMSTRMAKAKTP